MGDTTNPVSPNARNFTDQESHAKTLRDKDKSEFAKVADQAVGSPKERGLIVSPPAWRGAAL
jgi:hypothetical protein